MTLLKTPDANPAFLFALGQSLHWLEANQFDIADAEDLHGRIGLPDVPSKLLRTCVQQAMAAGMVTKAVQKEPRSPKVEGIGLTDPWDSVFGVDATLQGFALALNRQVQETNGGFADLHAVGRALLGMEVFSAQVDLPSVVEGWNKRWQEEGLDVLNLKPTQLEDLCRWMYFLGWIRRFGPHAIVPDFSPWLLSWLSAKPRYGVETANAFWRAMQEALPLLAPIAAGSQESLPEPIGIGLLALQERGLCSFSDPSDSPDEMLTVRVGGKSETLLKFRRVEWHGEERR
jgi:hypothetical protein